MSEDLQETETMRALERAGPARARFGGWTALAAGAPALAAPAAALALGVTGGADADAAIGILILSTAGAAPLAASAAIGLSRPLSGATLALACLPIALAGAIAAWLGGGVLSAAGPWIFAALAACAMLGGVRWAIGAALLGAAIGVALLVAPEPPLRLGGFAARDDRALAATLSWSAALASLAAVAWAALTAWAAALPPLRHPTIASRRSLAALTEASGVCALRIDGRGRVVHALGAAEDTLEMPRRALVGLSLADLVHPDDRDALKRMLRAERRSRDAAPDAEAGASDVTGPDAAAEAAPLVLRTRSRFGGYRWLEAKAAPAAGFPPPPTRPAQEKPAASGAESASSDSDSVAASAVSDDDSMLTLRLRWRSEREIGRGAEAQNAELLAHVNSALRERLKSVVGYTEILKNELFGPIGSPRYRDYARRAHEDGADLLELVDELLDLAEIEAGRYGAQLELVDPVPIVDGAVRLMSARAERAGVELIAETPPSTPHVRVDRRALRRVLINMLIDALRSAEMGDRVTLRTKTEEGAIEFQATMTSSTTAAGSEFDAETAEDDEPLAFQPPHAHATRDADPDSAEAQDARLGRMIASNLAERLGGSLVFAVDIAGGHPEPGVERLYAEAILPLGAPPKREVEDLDAAESGPTRVAAPSLWGAEEGAGLRRAREEAEERDVARPLFDLDAPTEPKPTADETSESEDAPEAPDAKPTQPEAALPSERSRRLAPPFPPLARTGSDD